MGLFKRDRGAGFGTAAFAEADVEDARRGRPAVSLERFAASVGLDFRGSEQAGAFVATQPTWPEYVFNACRGPLPGGRYGLLAHELFEVRAHNGSVEAAGRYLDIRTNTRLQGFEVGGIQQGPDKNEPFWGRAAWLPTTAVHVRTPEINRLPVLRFVRSTSHGVRGDNGLDAHGLPGFRTLGPDIAPHDTATFAAACAPWLAGRADAHVELRVRYGIVVLTVNGYLADEHDLRQLLAAAEGVAGALADIAPPRSPEPFDALGPAAGTVPPGVGMASLDPRMVPAYARQAAVWGLHHEDPSHLPALLPGCPIPGTPSGVLAGRLPGGTGPARVVWFEQGGRTIGSVRGGLVVPAAPGASTPLGGHLDAQTGVYVEVADGLACAWRKARSFGELEADHLLTTATTTLRGTGLAL